jgi:threonyl-tRNA synthetase
MSKKSADPSALFFCPEFNVAGEIMPNITLPDGSIRSFDAPVTVAEVAASIGAGLARAALAGKVDGKLVDTSHLMERDTQLAIVTDKDADGLEIIRHSTAHLLAYAVKELFPEAQVTIGPVIDNGFYYDFAYKRPFTPEDLLAIEKKMAELAKRDIPVSREVWARDDAVKFFLEQGEKYKAELIAAIPADQDVSLYREGEFVDLCRGPHVPSTGKLKVFKLMKVAGAYWRGDSKNEMLQRIYGTAWAKKEDQEAYLHMLEEAEKRDHRRIGKHLDLFHMQDEAPGMVFWHPRAGPSGRKSSSTCARSIATTATRKSAAPRFSTAACGRSPATGSTTRTTCSPRSRKNGITPSSR